MASKMLHHMSRIFEEKVSLKPSGVGLKIDSKLIRKLREKKVMQGHKINGHESSMEL